MLIDGPKIAAVQPASEAVPAGYRAIDLSGASVSQAWWDAQSPVLHRPAEPRRVRQGRGAALVPQMTFSAPRLYFANGVTTMRTTGSVEPYADLNVKCEIDTGHLIGPHMDVTGPYLEGATAISSRCTG